LIAGAARQVFRWIEPGQFLMGSTPEEVEQITDQYIRIGFSELEFPQHMVTLSEGFWLGDTLCTQALWRALLAANPSRFKEEADAAERPVEKVSWDDVQTFLERLNSELPEGVQACLPTEAQWEYAARAGTRTAYWWGDDADGSRANFGNQQKGTTRVKRYAPNPWGLHDVHGNACEWCSGSRRPYRDQAELDPPDGDHKPFRALRGGSWASHAGSARAAFRNDFLRGGDWPDAGFRLALRSVSPGGGAAVLGSRSET
jgi:formylglycine-generating enzyme required for sulfatase activity